jgi:hypothetical protein
MPSEKASIYEGMLSKQLLINYCSLFEGFILSVLMKLYLSKPEKILAQDNKSKSEQVVTYETLLKYDTLGQIIIDKIQEKVGKLTYESICTAINKIKLFYKGFNLDETLLGKVSDIYTIRNIIVHNKGVVNEEFLKRIVNNKGYKLGDIVEIKLSDFDGRVNGEGIEKLFENISKNIYNYLLNELKSS